MATDNNFRPTPESGDPIYGKDFAIQTREMVNNVGADARDAVQTANSAQDIATSAQQATEATQANLSMHIGDNTVHMATSEPTAERIIIRDENGLAKINTPVDDLDIANKDYVDTGDATVDNRVSETRQELSQMIGTNSSNIQNINNRLDDGDIASITGNAATASQLQTAREIRLMGAVSGSAQFDGSIDITINTTGGGGGSSDYAAQAGELTPGATIEITDGATSDPVLFTGASNIQIPITGIDASVINAGTVPPAYLPVASATNSGIITPEEKMKLDDFTSSVPYNKGAFSASLNGGATWRSDGSGNYVFAWTNFFMFQLMDNTASAASYVRVDPPASGTTVQSIGSEPARVYGDSGVILNTWTSLIARHAVGGGPQEYTLYLINHTTQGNEVLEPNDLFIAGNVGGALKLCSGHVLSPGMSIESGTYGGATQTAPGLMSAADKVKLNSSTANQTANSLAYRDGNGNISFNRAFAVDQSIPGNTSTLADLFPAMGHNEAFQTLTDSNQVIFNINQTYIMAPTGGNHPYGAGSDAYVFIYHYTTGITASSPQLQVAIPYVGTNRGLRQRSWLSGTGWSEWVNPAGGTGIGGDVLQTGSSQTSPIIDFTSNVDGFLEWSVFYQGDSTVAPAGMPTVVASCRAYIHTVGSPSRRITVGGGNFAPQYNGLYGGSHSYSFTKLGVTPIKAGQRFTTTGGITQTTQSAATVNVAVYQAI